MYDFLIVGSGLYGAVFAERCRAAGKRALVIDQRAHIGGNCYTENRDGIAVHVYGPHIFHTSNRRLWDYVQRFGQFNNFVLRPKVRYGDDLYSFPINLFTLYQLWGVSTPGEALTRLEAERVHVADPTNLEDWVLSQVGRTVYEKFIQGYTQKQWQRDPRQLPASIIRRLPIRTTFDDNYFMDAYQGIPVDGYTAVIARMLDGTEVVLGEDYLARQSYWDAKAERVVFTGCIDAFYRYCYGALEYRSLRFRHQRLEVPDFQGVAMVNYTSTAVPFTRIVEHKHFTGVQTPFTHITREYPETWSRGDVPYYPICDAENQARYEQYAALGRASPRYIFGGRLAEYRYYDMHQVIGSALHRCATLGMDLT